MKIFSRTFFSFFLSFLIFSLFFNSTTKAATNCSVSYSGLKRICAGSATVKYTSLLQELIPESYKWNCNSLDGSSGSEAAQPSNLVSYFKFDEINGTVANDSSGLGKNLALTNFDNTNGLDVLTGSGWTAANKSLGSGALMFNGNRNEASVSDSPELNPTSGVTLEAWVKKGASQGTKNIKLWEGNGSSSRISISQSQIVGNNIYYLITEPLPYFYLPCGGGSRCSVAPRQFWFGKSDLNGSNLTFQKSYLSSTSVGYVNFKVLDNKIYYVWGETTPVTSCSYGYGCKTNQLYTATSDLDGSNFSYVKRKDNIILNSINSPGIIFNGNRILYYWTELTSGILGYSNLDGSNWTEKQIFSNIGAGGGDFKIINDKIYFSLNYYSQREVSRDTDGKTLKTAISDLDGSNVQEQTRAYGTCGYVGNEQCPMGSVVYYNNGKIYYVWSLESTFQTNIGLLNPDGSLSITSKPFYLGQFFSNSLLLQKNGKILSLYSIDRYFSSYSSGATNALRFFSMKPDLSEISYVDKDLPFVDRSPIKNRYLSDFNSTGDKMYYLESLTTDYTNYSTWLRIEGSEILSKEGAYGLRLSPDGTKVIGSINHASNDPDGTVSGASVKTNLDTNWNHVVLTYDKSNIKLYLNGSLVSTTPYSSSINVNTNPLVLGSNFTGVLDTTRIYNRALTSAEVLDNYQKGDNVVINPPAPVETSSKDCLYSEPGTYRAALSVTGTDKVTTECLPGPILELTDQKSCVVEVKDLGIENAQYSNESSIYIEKEMDARVVRDCADGGTLVWSQPQNGRIVSYPTSETLRAIFNPAGEGNVGATLKGVPGASGDIVCKPATIKVRDKVKWGL